MICDSHVHFFSPNFFDTLGAQMGLPPEDRARVVADRAGVQSADSAEALADSWIAEMNRHGVTRAAMIASLPGDEMSVATAIVKHPSRLVGFFMLNPMADDALERAAKALDAGLRGICLFPAMQRYPLHDPRVSEVFDLVASRGEAAPPAVFVHCGVLSVGLRKKLGLPSPFDIRFGNPLDLHAVALRHPEVPVIIPHFGAGMLREALMLADLCPNVHLDTSSSNSWIRYTPGLTLQQVFRMALDILGADRLLFGTDSSFFPRGWVKDVYEQQQKALGDALAPPDARSKIFGGNFQRLFPLM